MACLRIIRHALGYALRRPNLLWDIVHIEGVTITWVACTCRVEQSHVGADEAAAVNGVSNMTPC
jgi:hypothetical protein